LFNWVLGEEGRKRGYYEIYVKKGINPVIPANPDTIEGTAYMHF